MQKIRPCLWFDTEGEDAAKFYTSIFPNSRIVDVSRYGSAGPRPEGTVMQVTFELEGQQFLALNGGPNFTFNEAISLEVDCETQEEVDKYWNALTDGGEEGPCGWLKDRYGVSWQIVPKALYELIGEEDRDREARAGGRRLTTLEPGAARNRPRLVSLSARSMLCPPRLPSSRARRRSSLRSRLRSRPISRRPSSGEAGPRTRGSRSVPETSRTS
jgi:predicted 3-demethylubiquinone-9 3-methyltransferase (glyoxalase superfamily)